MVKTERLVVATQSRYCDICGAHMSSINQGPITSSHTKVWLVPRFEDGTKSVDVCNRCIVTISDAMYMRAGVNET
jgi:ribosomal protein L28